MNFLPSPQMTPPLTCRLRKGTLRRQNRTIRTRPGKSRSTRSRLEIKNWQSKTDQPFKDLDVTPTDVENVFNAVSSVSSGTEPGGAYDLTQLVGWLSPEAAKGATRAWNFEIQGEVRYETASYRDGGRFDVLGPNGAQLATKWLSAEEIEGLLAGTQTRVEMEKTADLLQALDRRSAVDERLKRSRTIRGRFWLSNGQPIGIREVAILAPPAFDKNVGECCTADEIFPEDVDGCCDNEDECREVIRTPVALAFGQTDETGYFEISYIEPQGWDKAGPGFALVQISGVHAALAVALEKTSGKTVRFPDPLLLQVNEALLRTPDEEDFDPVARQGNRPRGLRRELLQRTQPGAGRIRL